MTKFSLLLCLAALAVGVRETAAQTAGCFESVIDIVFLVDGSGSICDSDPTFDFNANTCENWRLVTSFMESVVDALSIGENEARVGLVTFANEGITEFDMAEYFDKDTMKEQIRNLDYPGGNTNTYEGLRRMREDIFGGARGDRANVRNVAIVLTDGLPTRNIELTEPEADRAQAEGITMFSVGITESVDARTLQFLSSQPRIELEQWFTSPDFAGLRNVLNQLLEVACATPAPTPRPPSGCAESVIDLGIAVDGSGSICNNEPVDTCPNWELVRTFLISIVSALNIGRNDARVGLVSFANDGTTEWGLLDNADLNSQIDAIRSLRYPGGNTNTADGLLRLRQEVFNTNDDRRNVRNVVIVITDGIPTRNEDRTEPEALALQREGVIMFSVGITASINEDVLRILSSDPKRLDENYFTTPDFEGLEAVLAGLLTVACATQAPTTPSPAIGCNNNGDVVFIIDLSGSIGDRNFETMRSFLADLTGDLDVDNGRVRIALITYSDNAEVRFNLDRYTRRSDVIDFINNLQYTRGTTNTAQALEYARTQVFGSNGDRDNIPNIAVVMTDGGSNDKERTIEQAIAAKNNMHVLTLGIGNWVDEYELRAIASDPYDRNFWPIERFEDLFNFRERLRDALCNNNNECSSNPCRNGGTCVDGTDRYYCRCPFPYGGVNCEYRCRVPRDVVFTLDSSGSIGKENFQRVVDFSKAVVGQLPIEQGTNVGLITYGDSTKEYFSLNAYSTRAGVMDGMSIPFFSGGTTNTAGALRYLRQSMFNNGNNGQYPDVSVIITDGRSNDMSETWREAIEDRKSGIELIAVGVGNNVRVRELTGLASYPTQSNIFMVENFESLENIVNNIRDAICDETNECNSNPCRNGGECRDVIGGYYCECPRSFTGINCERRCPGLSDVLFIIDKSGSVRHERFDEVKSMLGGVVDRLEVFNDKVRIAAISFSDSATLEFNLDAYRTKQDIQEAIMRIAYAGGRTNIAQALELARDEVFQPNNGDRQDAPDFIIIFTDGGSNIRASDTIPQAILDRISGMHISAAAVGRDLNMVELRGIASSPVDENIYAVSSFSEINDLIEQIVMGMCNDNDECASNPCRNGGTCVDEYRQYVCICNAENTGENCERTCRRQYDMAFIIDLSGSVDSVYNVSMEFIKQVVYGLEFRFDTVRVALVSYSDESDTNFYLSTYRDRRDVLNALAFGSIGGRTNTQDALRRARDDVFTGNNGDRSGVPNKVVLLTDGGSNISPGNTIPNADELKRRGTEIHVIAIGDQVDMNEINAIATDPVEPYVYRISTRQDAIDRANRMLDSLCQ